MTLMIVAHPNFSHSIANKAIVDEVLKQHADIEVRHIHQLYPDYHIDVEAEQHALLRHDSIILQYPMYWFNMPAILKLWFDDVFTYQFAYGSQGNRLKDKKVMISMTVGQSENHLITAHENLMASFLKAVGHSIYYSQMQLVEKLFLYDVSPFSKHNEAEIQQLAIQHAKKLTTVIQTL